VVATIPGVNKSGLEKVRWPAPFQRYSDKEQRTTNLPYSIPLLSLCLNSARNGARDKRFSNAFFLTYATQE